MSAITRSRYVTLPLVPTLLEPLAESVTLWSSSVIDMKNQLLPIEHLEDIVLGCLRIISHFAFAIALGDGNYHHLSIHLATDTERLGDGHARKLV